MAETDCPLPARPAAFSSSSSSREYLAATGVTAESGQRLDFRLAAESATGELNRKTEIGKVKPTM